jgi:hypothetical protein
MASALVLCDIFISKGHLSLWKKFLPFAGTVFEPKLLVMWERIGELFKMV